MDGKSKGFKRFLFCVTSMLLMSIWNQVSTYAALGDWTARQAITDIRGISLRPQVAGIGNTLYVTFMHKEGTEPLQIYFMKSSDAGVTFSDPVALTNDAWDHYYPTIAATETGNVYIAWQDQRSGPWPDAVGDIFFVRSTDGGATFQTPLRITPEDSYPSRVPALLADGNNVYMCWFDADMFPDTWVSGIFFRKSTDGGASWSAPIILTEKDGIVDNEHPKIAKDASGRVHILFRSTRMGNPWGGWPPFDIFHYLSINQGASWLSSAIPVSPVLPEDINNTFGADLTISDNGVLHAAWWEEKSGMNVFYRRSADGGLSWGPVIQLSNYDFSMKEPNSNASGGLQGEVSIITDESNCVYVAWHSFEAVSYANISYGEIQVRRSTDNGISFHALETLDSQPSASNIELAKSSSKIHLFYEGHDSGAVSDELEYRYVSTVNSQPPDGSITSPTGDLLKIKPGVMSTFSGNGTDPDGTVGSYLWDWGGARQNITTGPGGSSTVAISFPEYGDFTVQFIPFDNYLEPDPIPATFLLRVADLSDNSFFVRQLYLDFLNREPDPDGLAYWVSQLNAGSMSRAQVTYEYFRSYEFQNNGAYLGRLYAGILFRRAEYEGFMFWLNELNSGRRTKLEILEAFIVSPEFQEKFGGNLTNQEFVRRLYLNILEREPDQAGSDFWTATLDSGEMTRPEVAFQFIESPEFIAKTENNIFVQLEYMGLLRREAEDDGFDFWVSQFEQGRSKLDLIQGFIFSEEYRLRFEN